MPIFEDKLDFHEFGLITAEQAAFYLDRFLQESYVKKYLQVLVVTGSGRNSPGGQGILRRSIAIALKQHPLVTSFKSASSANGGLGAFEVYLKDC